MGFLSIAFLSALPLAAAPILLHLLDRRRNVVIEWGAMQFLMEAASRRTNARKLKQWLLLLMRVLAVAALVFALARPMLPGNWFGTTDRGETVFVIDNSMSMMRTAGEAPLFDSAIERAVAELHELPAGDSVRVLLASPYPVWATPGSMRVDSGSREIVADQLKELRPTNGRSDLLSALFAAVQAEVEPTQQRRNIVLLTDGQGSDWSIGDDAGWKRFREVLQTAAIPTELEVVELNQDSKHASNIAVNEIRSSRTVVGVDQTFTLTAQIQNHGRADSSPSSVYWSIGERDEHESHVPSLDGGQVQDVSWKYSFAETGVYALSCRVDAEDELAPDNSATVVVEVVDEVPVVLVENAPELAEMQRDSFFVQAALGWIDGETMNEQGVHVPTLTDHERLSRLDIEHYRAVVIPNLTSIDEELVRKLQEFVYNGGGLWVALGPRTDVEAFNQLFFADGNGVSPLSVSRIVDEESQQTDLDGRSRRPTIDPFVEEHPATGALADNERLDLGDVTVSRRFRFVPPPEGEDVSVLLSLSNGEPLAIEKYLGRGRVIIQSIPLRMQWSELAKSQAFVVMVQDWLAYLTQPRATRHNLSPGDPISVLVNDREIRDAMLKTPHGDEIELTADLAGGGVVFRSSRTILPGEYSLELGLSGDQIPFQVNRDPLESNLTPLTTADHELLAEVVGLAQDTQNATWSSSNHSDPLWPILFMLLIGLIAAELVLSGIISRERFGSDPIAETTEHWVDQSMGIPFGMNPGSRASLASETKPPTHREAPEETAV